MMACNMPGNIDALSAALKKTLVIFPQMK